jgi:hypothetical protein
MPLRSMRQAMHEYKAGELNSGKGGPIVKDRKQAIAIGLSAERRNGPRASMQALKSHRRGK